MWQKKERICQTRAKLYRETWSRQDARWRWKWRKKKKRMRAEAVEVAATAGEIAEAISQGVACCGVGEGVLYEANALTSFLPEPVVAVLRSVGLMNVFMWLTNAPAYQSLAAVAAVVYFVFAPPGVLAGILDFYVLNGVDKTLQKRWNEDEFVLGRVRGRGNFGTVYEAFRVSETGARPETRGNRAETPGFVLKRLKQDRRGVDIRTDFLKKGTIASGAGETGRAEMYMNGRMRRSLAGVTAAYLGNFTVRETNAGFINGEEFIVWKYESDSTLEDYLDDPSYPDKLETVLYGRVRDEDDEATRLRRVARDVIRQVLNALAKFHAVGLVHRDIKPSNMLVTERGRVIIIDLGACADLRMGINFNPDEGLLDPDYCPPERLVVPKTAPRSGSPVLAALGSPVFWLAAAPDLFDTYSAGIVLLRLLIPTLRKTSFLSPFNKELEKSGYDLRSWRKDGEPQAIRSDYEAADSNFGLGWDLACRLVCPRGVAFRGRMSASAALRHPFLL